MVINDAEKMDDRRQRQRQRDSATVDSRDSDTAETEITGSFTIDNISSRTNDRPQRTLRRSWPKSPRRF